MSEELFFYHTIFGVAAFVIGICALVAPKRPGFHPRFGDLYHAAMALMFVTAAALAWQEWSRVFFLFFVALLSYGFALMGYVAAKRRRGEWLVPHVAGILFSYVGLLLVLVLGGALRSS
ncbi:MAG: hypothetical protein AB1513_01965 [Pseudomonadota bacterium]